jgi:hypothetical protein
MIQECVNAGLAREGVGMSAVQRVLERL